MRLVWAVSLPILFAEVGEIVIHATDTALLGRVGRVELGALAIADTVVELAIVPAVGLADGVQVLIARRLGQGRREAVASLFHRGLLVAVVVSALLVAALQLGAPAIADGLVSSAAVAAAVEDFLRFAAFGVFFLGLNLYLSSLYVGLARTRILISATLVLALVNLALSYALVFGEAGLPRLGIEGAGIAFLGAEAATFLYLAAHAARRLGPAYGLFRPGRAEGEVLGPVLRISFPVALQALVEGARWFAFFLIVERAGEAALAASNIVFSAYLVLLVPSVAFAETVYSLVSNVVGRGRADRITPLMRRTVASAFALTLPLAALGIAFPDFVVSVFAQEGTAPEGAASVVRVVALSMLVVVPAELWLAAVLGTGDADAALGVELLVSAVIVGGAWYLALEAGVDLALVWLVLPASSLLGLATTYAWVRAGPWRRRVAEAGT